MKSLTVLSSVVVVIFVGWTLSETPSNNCPHSLSSLNKDCAYNSSPQKEESNQEESPQQESPQQESPQAKSSPETTTHSVGSAWKLNNGNRLRHLDDPCDPYYVGTYFPKLTTRQWVGEPDVDAVVVLAIDDMRDTAKYEAYLRPILDRLKKIDGRAPVSIMTNDVKPDDPQLQTWLKEGVSIEIHTVDHPCPLLAGGDFPKAKSTYDRCIENMSKIEGNDPVAFRMPCCDSLNTPSPRFYKEIFNKTTPGGKFLTIDTSVFNALTPEDPDLPAEQMFDRDGRSRFGKYIPFPSFVNRIENYPYPYVIAQRCWQFPCVVPSDWSAQHLQRPFNPKTVEDFQVALDLVVKKRGVYNLVFHPHGWIRNDQIVSLVDHAVEKHNGRVKFLTFKETNALINQHLLIGHPIRNADGGDNGVRLLDIDADGYQDVVIGNDKLKTTRIWDEKKGKWFEQSFPFDVRKCRFGTVKTASNQSVTICLSENNAENSETKQHQLIVYRSGKWQTLSQAVDLFADNAVEAFTKTKQLGRFLDLDGDGTCEYVAGKNVFQFIKPTDSAANDDSPAPRSWELASYQLPMKDAGDERKTDSIQKKADTELDPGYRFVDINEDGMLDFIRADQTRSVIRLFAGIEKGWSLVIEDSTRDEAKLNVPVISRSGTNNGVFFHSRHMWAQNEDTNRLPDLVERLSYDEILKALPVQPKNLGQPKPLPPSASILRMKTRPELEIQLVAAEPLIADPVAIDWDAEGNLWVVEMGDYPLAKEGKPNGRVKKLVDKNGDGVFETSTLFLDGLSYPTGIKFWKDGVIVSAAPNVIFAKDTTGDGKANLQTVLLSGFAEGNQQHRVNGLRWGLDNRLHLANGDSGGEIVSPQLEKKISIRGRDLRMLPSGYLQATTGQTQFGRNRDDFGNWLGGNNSNPMWQYALRDHYLSRNSHVQAPNLRHHVSDRPGPANIFPLSKTLERFNDFDRANRFTSACSPIIFRDSSLGNQFRDNAFVCEPVHNLVHREVVTRTGIYLNSTRPNDEKTSEFLASSDNWFRPVMARTGPDGALWIVDMYRLVIEHPEWISADWQARLDLHSGNNRGRIYRVVRRGDRPTLPKLAQKTNSELVTELRSANGTIRDLAHQMLVWRGAFDVLPALEKLAIDLDASPRTVVQTLAAIRGLTEEKEKKTDHDLDQKRWHLPSVATLKKTLSSESPEVRAASIRMCEDHAQLDQLIDELHLLSEDKDPIVRFQLACSLGFCQFPVSHATMKLQMILSILEADGNDPLFLAAGLSSLSPTDSVPKDFIKQLKPLSLEVASETVRVVIQTTKPNEQNIALQQIDQMLNDKLSDKEISLNRKLAFVGASLDAIDGAPLETTTKTVVDRMLNLCRSIADDDTSPTATRVQAIRLLAKITIPDSRDSQDASLLRKLIDSRNANEIQVAAFERLLAVDWEAAISLVTERWSQMTPSMRTHQLSQLLQRRKLAGKVLELLQNQTLKSSDFNLTQRQILRDSLSAHSQAAFDRIATQTPINSDRKAIVEKYLSGIATRGNPVRGKLVFTKQCSNCHRIDGIGKTVGPDLAAITSKQPIALLQSILDPNQAIEQKYQSYLIETTAGLQHTGILKQETGNTITLVTLDNKEISVPRDRIESIASTGKSYMPEGLEKEIDVRSMADLIEFLREKRQTPKRFDNNDPVPVKSTDDGRIEALATTAAIYGPSLIFEQKYKNLGFWSNPQDYAEWTVIAKKSGSYQVELEYACASNSAGDMFIIKSQSGSRLEIENSRKRSVHGRVAGTGTWDNYAKVKLGEIFLAEGENILLMRSSGPIKSAMLDLKAIRLTPLSE